MMRARAPGPLNRCGTTTAWEDMRSAVGRLRRRPDFLHVAAARGRGVTPGLILQARTRPSDAAEPGDPVPRVGFTASRKVGGAVQRNRARRRLRAVVEQVMPIHATPEKDYVVVARAATPARPFAALIGDLEAALRKLHAWHDTVEKTALKDKAR